MDTILAQFELAGICYESSIKLLRCGLIRSANFVRKQTIAVGSECLSSNQSRNFKKVCNRLGGQGSGVRDQRSGVTENLSR